MSSVSRTKSQMETLSLTALRGMRDRLDDRIEDTLDLAPELEAATERSDREMQAYKP